MPGEWRPYLMIGYKSVTGSANDTIVWTTGASEEVKISQLRFMSTGAYDITRIADQGGIPYTNADTANVLDSNLWLNIGTPTEFSEIFLPVDWNLVPNTKITFSVTDTSTATNEIWILGIGSRRTL